MSTAISTPAFNVNAAPSTSPLEFAVQQILAKERKAAILSQISSRWGFSNEDALAIVNRAYALKHAHFRKAGLKTLVIGIVMLVLGVLITAASYSLVSKSGGTYFITTGVIIVGVVNIVKGLVRIVIG